MNSSAPGFPSVDCQELAPPLKGCDRSARTDVRAYTNSAGEPIVVSVPEDPPVCWICLDCGTNLHPLQQVCKCPRQAHLTCVARWQLQSAGTRKETHCEFCDCQLPDWKKTLTPQCGANAPAVMNVNFDGRTYSFEVRPGPDGYKQFTEAIRKAFNLPDDSELNITFTCDEPVAVPDAPPPTPPPTIPAQMMPQMVTQSMPVMMEEELFTPPTSPSGSLLTLQGAGAYDAAVHCASVSAARRITQHSPGSLVMPETPDMIPTPGVGPSLPGPPPARRRSLGNLPPRPHAPIDPEDFAGRRSSHGPGQFLQKMYRKVSGKERSGSRGPKDGSKDGEER